jgi:hypothetical protein
LQLPHDIQQRLATEYRFAAQKMREATQPIRKIFFFSALFTEISRIVNGYWDRDLVLLHWTLQATHNTLTQGSQPGVRMLTGDSLSSLLEAATQLAEELAEHMEQEQKDSNLFKLLARIAEVGYAATPHGAYVMEKGLITFPPPPIVL